MKRQSVMIKNKTVIILSPDFIISAALAGLQSIKKECTVYAVSEKNELLSVINRLNPDYIVLDLPARDCVFLLCTIRRQFPALPVIIIRARHFFSDAIVASWFGNIWLKEYRTLMAGYPSVAPTDYVDSHNFQGTECVGACSLYCRGKADSTQILSSLQKWLEQRLSYRFPSRQGMRVIMNWLESGGTARDVGQRIGRSEKLVYHYRWRIMQELGLSNTALEFIPSVTVSAGYPLLDCSQVCRMRFRDNQENISHADNSDAKAISFAFSVGQSTNTGSA